MSVDRQGQKTIHGRVTYIQAPGGPRHYDHGAIFGVHILHHSHMDGICTARLHVIALL